MHRKLQQVDQDKARLGLEDAPKVAESRPREGYVRFIDDAPKVVESKPRVS